MSAAFARFVGVDWSGARGPALPGLQVAMCGPGEAAPRLVANPAGGRWTRSDFAAWLAGLARSGGRALVGLDFAFAYPWCDRRTYFPGCPGGFAGAPGLWDEVDRVCADAGDLYAGPFYGRAEARYAAYLHVPGRRGARFDGARLRRTERACGSGTPPSCVFNCVGPAAVGVGSLAGMRLLAHLKRRLGEALAVWPFDGARDAALVAAEIFPRLYFRQAGRRPAEWHKPGALARVLAHHRSAPPRAAARSKDEADALVAAAALRALSSRSQAWRPTGLTAGARRFEGWILGSG